MKAPNPTYGSQGTTIFAVMSGLATEAGAINLGQGFPDDEGPADIRAAAARAITDGPNQYPPMMGMPELREAVATHAQRFYGLDLDWRTQVLITSGATEALAASLSALLSPGDEAILIEPFFDTYLPVIEAAGATARCVKLHPPTWHLDLDELASAFSAKTKLILVNTPHNPIGRVLDAAELSTIAELCQRHDVVAVCDEVYEHMVFDRLTHSPLMTMPGMADRVVRIQSAGKIFSLTGWKVGFITGSAELVSLVSKAHQNLVFTTPPGLQLGVAYGLGKEDAFFRDQAGDLAARRDILRSGLEKVGFDISPCEGTYFLTADIRPFDTDETDDAFCRRITTQAKVAAVPISAFYAPASPDIPRHYIRFCFCKRPQVLEEACDRLSRYLG
ncbi:aminotransferase [Pyruvatibacter sp.]|uniref:aminotransferase n=1 Tax=Pyruvatibacter sp. TaxID=1981328 RepID=UPI0032ECDCEB